MPSRKGSPNRNKSFLLKKLQDMYGDDFHPILKIAQNCSVLQTEVEEIELPNPNEGIEEFVTAKANRANAIKSANAEWSRIAEYTEPKLKATEISGPDGGAIQIAEVKRSIVDPEEQS